MSEHIPQDFIDDLIERADLSEVIGNCPTNGTRELRA